MAERSPSAQTRTTGASTSRDESFVEYVKRRQRSLLGTAFLLTGDAQLAEDLVQTALTDLYRSWDKVVEPDARDSYVHRILVNANISAWRRPWRRREFPASDLAPDRSDEIADDPDNRFALWELVKTLPPNQRAVIVLRFFEDLSIPTIADLMNIPPGTVKSRANRALATLRANPELKNLEDWS